MPISKKDVSRPREENISKEANSRDSTHNNVTSIAAALLIIKLAQKYLFKQQAAASSSRSSMIRSIRAGENDELDKRIDRNINRYLSRKDSNLDANACAWLNKLLRAGRPVNSNANIKYWRVWFKLSSSGASTGISYSLW